MYSVPSRKRTSQILLVGLLVTSVAVSWMIWLNLRSYQEFRNIIAKQMELEKLRGTIIHLDEVLTMSARMAAITGDLGWEQRYRKYQPTLDGSILRALALMPKINPGLHIRRTLEANTLLERMESNAFDWIRRGQKEKAVQLLFGPEYEDQKRLYSEGVRLFANRIQNYGEESIEKMQNRSYWFILNSTVLLLILGTIWGFIIRMISRWTYTLSHMNTILDERVKQRTEELRKQQAFVAHSSKMRALGEMAGGIGHEINNPLTAIQLSAGQIKKLAREGSLDQEAALSIADRIENTVSRISRIIKGLRLFAREGGFDPFLDTPIFQILEDTLELCRERFKHHKIPIYISPRSSSLTIECRPTQISQVFLNLMSNAFDAVEFVSDKWIRIDIFDTENDVEICFTNSGPSISQEIRDRIFQPFFTTKPVDKGTGLGLSISKGIVETHHGSLELDTTNEHPRFVIRLPKKQPPAVEIRQVG